MSQANPYAAPKADVEAPPDGTAPVLWNPNAAGAWSLLFTPIFGSILLLKNWRAIGLEDKVRSARIWLIASVVMLIPVMLIGFVGLVYIIVWYFAWQKPQATFVRERWGTDYPRKSWAQPLLIAFACWFVVVLVLFAIAMQMVTVTR